MHAQRHLLSRNDTTPFKLASQHPSRECGSTERRMAMTDKHKNGNPGNAASDEAASAFDETEAGKLRRRAAAHKLDQAPGERDGRDGPEPTRYGDWEKKGIISDF